tara:strand:+ start:113 stop:1579 length:1467 start_codon:yes stop_codon:yes gene_type:complete
MSTTTECVITSKAKELITRYNLKNVKPYHESFIDVEAVLQHLRTNYELNGLVKTPDLLCSDNLDISCTASIRPYQDLVVKKILKDTKINPTLVVMPCGSGKTVTGIYILSKIKDRTLIVTNYKIVAKQWKHELMNKFSVSENDIDCVSDTNFMQSTEKKLVTIVTYDTLISISTTKSRSTIVNILNMKFSLIILDEAHKAVASLYFSIIYRLSGPVVAFTATPVREDSELRHLEQLVQNTMEIDSDELISSGYISRIVCSTIIVPTDAKLYSDKLTHTQKISAAVINPYKLAYIHVLLTKMLSEKQRVIIFCDDIFSMMYVHGKLKQIYDIIGPVTMQTSLCEREKCVQRFLENDNEGKIIMLSRTGDEGLDIPCATKLIQICTPWGSRRQHAQRVGRVQRPCNDIFTLCEAITLVSDNTLEVEFAKRRDEYLLEMKYEVHLHHLEKNQIVPWTTSDEVIADICKKQKKRKGITTKKKPVKKRQLKLL